MGSYSTYVSHGIAFIDKDSNSCHTWKNWRIVPTSRPVINPPTPRKTYVSIPGSDGVLDLSESLTGEMKYDNRTGSIEFQVMNKEEWYEVYSDVMDFLQGQKLKAILDDDPSYYYEGRFAVNAWKSDKQHSRITIDYDVAPYKLELYSSVEDWIWDSFNFETGMIRDYREIRVDGAQNYIIHCNRMSVIPRFTVTLDEGENEMQIRWNGGDWSTHKVGEGTYTFPTIRLTRGKQNIYLNGHGYVTIEYRGGRF